MNRAWQTTRIVLEASIAFCFRLAGDWREWLVLAAILGAFWSAIFCFVRGQSRGRRRLVGYDEQGNPVYKWELPDEN